MFPPHIFIIFCLMCTSCIKHCNRQSTFQNTSAQPAFHTTKPYSLVFLGDSLTAGYGLALHEAFPTHIQSFIHEDNLPWVVTNAGVSGDTSAGGLARVDWIFQSHVDMLFVCLGGNDGLRGFGAEQTRENLESIITYAQKKGAQVVLAGMFLPQNYGVKYSIDFHTIYTNLADQYKLPLFPFLLEGIALKPEYTLPDGTHPNPKGAQKMAHNIYTFLKPLLTSKRTLE
jgi:acyl-CoA thioesterase I